MAREWINKASVQQQGLQQQIDAYLAARTAFEQGERTGTVSEPLLSVPTGVREIDKPYAMHEYAVDWINASSVADARSQWSNTSTLDTMRMYKSRLDQELTLRKAALARAPLSQFWGFLTSIRPLYLPFLAILYGINLLAYCMHLLVRKWVLPRRRYA
jgi:hypothetical protein